eukprot:EG_transcript_33965
MRTYCSRGVVQEVPSLQNFSSFPHRVSFRDQPRLPLPLPLPSPLCNMISYRPDPPSQLRLAADLQPAEALDDFVSPLVPSQAAPGPCPVTTAGVPCPLLPDFPLRGDWLSGIPGQPKRLQPHASHSTPAVIGMVQSPLKK